MTWSCPEKVSDEETEKLCTALDRDAKEEIQVMAMAALSQGK